MKKAIKLILTGMMLLSMCSCNEDPIKEEKEREDMKEINSLINMEQTGYTVAVPETYRRKATEQGQVVRIEYDSKDYVKEGSAINKTAYVYLPYGYDENDEETRYDVIYLMHGWGGHAGEYFEFANLKELFDNMIENGDIRPAIIVSPTFYNDNSDTDFSSSVAEFRQFHRDFEENLMKAVEGRFHTYAKSTADQDLKDSRDHRIFGGFSLGSVTTWLQFCYDSEYIRYFLPMSGSSWYYGGYGDFRFEQNVDHIEEVVRQFDLEEKGYFIYHAVGTNDAVKSQSIDMAEEMLSREMFTSDHYVFYQKERGYHDHEAVREYLYNALPLFIGTKERKTDQTIVYNKDTKIQDIINDPLFEDYGKLIFPVNEGYMSGTTLGDLRLTWFSNIDPDKTVEIVNYMASEVSQGNTVFYDIYSEEEKKADPAKKDTGLFFFKGKEGGKTAIINAGGGFAYVGAIHDSFPHALELSKRGRNAFALIYRPGAQTACEDLARAIGFLYENQEVLGIDMNDYSLWGGSAGGRMAAWLGSFGTESFGEKKYPRPAAVIVNYTGLSEVTGNEPPTYSAVGTSDYIADYRTMERRIEVIQRNGTDTQIDVFKGLPHGFGLGTGTVAEGWIDHAVAFWERNMNY